MLSATRINSRPITFFLYVNDIFNCAIQFSYNLFSDDTTNYSLQINVIERLYSNC